jgi:copper chaperone NosL
MRMRCLLLSFALLAVVLSACQEPPAKPVDIKTETDQCTSCKMPIQDARYAAEMVDHNGTMRKFDEVGCLVTYIKNKVPRHDFRAIFVSDYDGKQWLKADEAVFVKSEAIKTPSDGGVVAFRDKTRADAVASQFKGQVIAFADLLK